MSEEDDPWTTLDYIEFTLYEVSEISRNNLAYILISIFVILLLDPLRYILLPKILDPVVDAVIIFSMVLLALETCGDLVRLILYSGTYETTRVGSFWLGLLSFITLFCDISSIYASFIMNSRQSLASTDDQRLSAFSLIEALRVARTYRFLLLFHYFNSRNEDDADFLTVEGGENAKTDAVSVVETGSFKTHGESNSNAVADKSFKTNTKKRKQSRAASFKRRRRRSSSRRESSFIPNRRGKLIEKVKAIEMQPAIEEEKPTIKRINTEKHDGPEEIKVGEHSRGDDAGLSKNLWYSISDTIATNVIL